MARRTYTGKSQKPLERPRGLPGLVLRETKREFLGGTRLVREKGGRKKRPEGEFLPNLTISGVLTELKS